MPQTYKHKRNGRTAELCESNPAWYRVNHHLNNYHLVHPELIEGCSDREEVVEKDWIGECLDELRLKQTNTKEEDREIIKKHAPKQKKFTEKEVRTRAEDKCGSRYILKFLEENNLLASEGITDDNN